jgi:hypothetical protein
MMRLEVFFGQEVVSVALLRAAVGLAMGIRGGQGGQVQSLYLPYMADVGKADVTRRRVASRHAHTRAAQSL